MKMKLGADDNPNVIGKSPQIRAILDTVERAANSQSTVMIYGERGTGKELVARTLHRNSPRQSKPFIVANCAAIPHDLLESELFGYEKNAFAGATNARAGRIELANHGTLFFDEVGDLPPAVQTKLLRVFAEGKIDRAGSVKSTPIDIRVIAATHRNMEAAVAESRFREDLYYKLNVIPITLPPLRDRKTDIPLLVNHFLNQFRGTDPPKTIDRDAMNILENYSWPGNIRELENFVERMQTLSVGSLITARDLPDKVRGDIRDEKWTPLEKNSAANGNPAQILQQSLKQSFHAGIPNEGVSMKKLVKDFEKALLIEALEKTGWVKNKAADLLGLKRTTLIEKLRKLKIIGPA